MKKTESLVDSEWLVRALGAMNSQSLSENIPLSIIETPPQNNPKIVIVDCRFELANSNWGETEYNKSHIPGAYYLNLDHDLSGEVRQHGGRHPLPNINKLEQKFSNLGIIKNETLVVAYDDSRFAFAARLWWLLRYLGHDKVALLDGGWNGWIDRGYPVTNAIPELKSGNFTATPNSDWLVDIEMVKAAKDNDSVIVIDSRDSDRYTGLREPIDPIAGSIPGAFNSPWKQVTNDSGYLQPLKQQQLWNNYRDAEEIIVYCGSGVTACVNLFSLELAGFTNTKLYPGGWSDWCSYLN